MQYFLKQLCENFEVFGTKIAFNIEEQEFTYTELGYRISTIQNQLLLLPNEQYFAVVTRNHIDTFATIFALWLTGKTMVPISASNPKERNAYAIQSVEIKTIFDASAEQLLFEGTKTIQPSLLPKANVPPQYVEVDGETDLYILFTSGSTGRPKGVRISQKNIQSYFEALKDCGYDIDHSDRFLNIYELTFDASVQCYAWPLVLGASVYTISSGGIKFLNMVKTLQDHAISVVKMTPSVLFYLQRYFNQIKLPYLRYSLFGAEALPEKLISEWQNCVPNAKIYNVYGPTEATVNCTHYRWSNRLKNTSLNGIISIGKPYSKTIALICDEVKNPLPNGTKGELCLSGPQITKGYWLNEELNKRSFFQKEINGINHRFYRTGDLATMDAEGDIFFLGRIDAQVQIDGHRVELGEIEHYAHKFSGVKTVALAATSDGLHKGITLFVESEQIDKEKLSTYLREQLPAYMLPSKIVLLEQIPLLISGKTDRVKLKSLL